jgi:hypothetical protein
MFLSLTCDERLAGFPLGVEQNWRNIAQNLLAATYQRALERTDGANLRYGLVATTLPYIRHKHPSGEGYLKLQFPGRHTRGFQPWLQVVASGAIQSVRVKFLPSLRGGIS